MKMKWMSIFVLCFSLMACTSEKPTEVVEEPTTEKVEKKVLVAYFARPGENSGVGVVEKGNTAFLAEAIASQTNGELFQIEPIQPYPISYEETTDLAKQEQEEQARPSLKQTVPNVDSYDIVFLGYPIWWSDMPMAMYTFLESNNLQDKVILPFCTHAGGGISNSVTNLKALYPNTTIADGFAMSGDIAQKDEEETNRLVSEWLQREEIQAYLTK